jgi:hypothetical protein
MGLTEPEEIRGEPPEQALVIQEFLKKQRKIAGRLAPPPAAAYPAWGAKKPF